MVTTSTAYMNSIGEQCNELKKQYDQCFNEWFALKFLKGDTNDSVCMSIFKQYQQCVKNAMKDQQIELKDVEEHFLDNNKEKKPDS